VAKTITNKQRVWLARYLSNGLNATEAARHAGYSDALKSGYENSIKLHTEIEAALKKKAMSRDEVLARIAEQARGSILDIADLEIIDAEQGYIRLDISPEAAVRNGKAHLVHSVEYDREGRPKLKMYNAQRALDMLARAHGIYQSPDGDDDGQAGAWLEAYQRSRE
jgi:phage terminase small subunit